MLELREGLATTCLGTWFVWQLSKCQFSFFLVSIPSTPVLSLLLVLQMG